jgi:hypothetical protein
MSDFLAAIMPHLLEAIGIIAGAIFSFASMKIAGFISSRVKSEDLQRGMLALNNAIWTAVREAEQTGRKSLLKAQEDGEISAEEIDAIKKELKHNAVSRAKEIGGEQGVALLKTAIGEIDIDKYIDARIEAEIHELRNQ